MLSRGGIVFRDVINSYTTRDEWEIIRKKSRACMLETMGEMPSFDIKPQMETLEESRYQALLLEHFRFQAVPGIYSYGTLVRPAESDLDDKHSGVLCIHGTDDKLAHRNVLCPTERPDRQYAIELARRGMVCLAVDQFGFGAGNGDHTRKEVVSAFYDRFPEWSLDGIRLWIHQCAIDLLASCRFVDESRLGCMGNSLGGRAAVYLAAFDSRINAAVPSAGMSPNLTNAFRNLPREDSLSPRLDAALIGTGIAPFEYQELLSLIAPRAVLVIEPWNDAYNPMIEPVFRCFEKARFVFELCERPDNLQILCHGDGHNTTKTTRDYAYAWFADKLG